jgi:putative ABC transport system permease protein
MDALLRDLTLAFRLLRRRAGFSTLAVVVLALAIGATSAIFSVVEAVLLREPAFPDPGRLVLVWERNTVRGRDRNVVGPYNFVRWRERTQSFTGLAAFTATQGNLTGGHGLPERLDVGAATGNLFAVLGVTPLLGRTLDESDSRPDAPDVAVLSEALWRQRFAADPGLIGQTITVSARPRVVVGVVPSTFQIPPGAALWLPITLNDDMRNARGRWMTVVGRLKPEVSLVQARDEMSRVYAGLVQENPDFNTGWATSVYPLHADMVREVRPALGVLMGAVGLLLLVACANIANLLLARAITREREVAIRQALGAGPFRVIRQLMTESLVLGVLGGVSGLLLGAWLLQGLVALLPAEVRLMTAIGLNGRVVAFTACVSLVCALAFGLVPALQQAWPSLVPALKEGGGVRGASHGRRRLKSGLVAAEVALSLVLTAGTAVLLRSFWNLAHVDPGFRAEGVLTTAVDLPRATYGETEKQVAFFTAAVERLAALPGVTSAGAISWTPLGRGSATRFRLPDRPAPAPGQEPVADVRMVTPGVFRTLGIRLVAGRDVAPGDITGRPRVVIVNETLARESWPGEDALGKRVVMEWGEEMDAEVVAVVGDVRLASLDTPARATLYWPQTQVPNGFMTLMARTDGDPLALAGGVRGVISSLDPELPPGRMRPMEEVVAGSLERQSFLLRLLVGFAALALGLAVIGVYGVMAYSVIERVPEIGVRLAIGAGPRDIVRLMLEEGARLGLVGVGLGLLAAIPGAGALQGLVFGVAPRDPLSLAAVAVVLLLATLLAAWLPARRAGRLDPVKALRTD